MTPLLLLAGAGAWTPSSPPAWLSRRSFIGTAALSGLGASAPQAAEAAEGEKPSIMGFTPDSFLAPPPPPGGADAPQRELMDLDALPDFPLSFPSPFGGGKKLLLTVEVVAASDCRRCCHRYSK